MISLATDKIFHYVSKRYSIKEIIKKFLHNLYHLRYSCVIFYRDINISSKPIISITTLNILKELQHNERECATIYPTAWMQRIETLSSFDSMTLITTTVDFVMELIEYLAVKNAKCGNKCWSIWISYEPYTFIKNYYSCIRPIGILVRTHCDF